MGQKKFQREYYKSVIYLNRMFPFFLINKGIKIPKLYETIQNQNKTYPWITNNLKIERTLLPFRSFGSHGFLKDAPPPTPEQVTYTLIISY